MELGDETSRINFGHQSLRVLLDTNKVAVLRSGKRQTSTWERLHNTVRLCSKEATSHRKGRHNLSLGTPAIKM
jgi:hypothetical protein